VFLTTIIAGCGYPPTLVPTSAVVETIAPTPEIEPTPIEKDKEACPIVSNPNSETSLAISITNITFAIDESYGLSKVDKENYRYKITKFILEVFHEVFQKVSISATYRVNYLFNNLEPVTVGTPIPSTDTEKVPKLFEELDRKIGSLSANQGNFSSHDKYLESFVNERNTATSMGNRILFYFTDGTFYLNDAGEQNSNTFRIMDDFSQQVEKISNSPESSDRVVFFVLTRSENMKPFARTYWHGIDTI
jgi:hypothetical protein